MTVASNTWTWSWWDTGRSLGVTSQTWPGASGSSIWTAWADFAASDGPEVLDWGQEGWTWTLLDHQCPMNPWAADKPQSSRYIPHDASVESANSGVLWQMPVGLHCAGLWALIRIYPTWDNRRSTWCKIISFLTGQVSLTRSVPFIFWSFVFEIVNFIPTVGSLEKKK